MIVDHPEKLGLAPGKSTSHGDVYDVSLFHQLHCLKHIRTYLYTMKAALNKTRPLDVYEVLLAPMEEHVEHCFDYLRQAVMCAGDMSLEWPRTESDGRRFAVDGWGIPHQCKSWVSSSVVFTTRLSRTDMTFKDAITAYMNKNTVARAY